MISIDDFSKCELKAGTVLEAEYVEGSEKLINLTVDLGEDLPESGPRTILTGLRQWKTLEDFKGKQLIFVTNLEPRKMMGFESQGMIVACEGEDGSPVFLIPEQKVPNGSKIR